ncbi:FecR domain-containing protein [Echinicola sediminis]
MEESKLIKYILKESSEKERWEVENWLQEHPDHQRKYNHLQLIWEKSIRISPSKTIDVNDAWQTFLENREGSSTIPLKNKSLSSAFKIAAAISVFFVATVLLYSNYMQPDNFFLSNLQLESEGSSTADTLFDGSIITLNKKSQLSFNQSIISSKRKASLTQGEAFFQIAKNENQPFLLEAGPVSLRVLGTSFNVKRKASLVEIVLKTGSVQVDFKEETRIISPGQMLSINTQTDSIALTLAKDNLYDYYVGEFFKAEQTPLWRIVEILNEAYGANITILNNSLRNLPLTTTFRNDSLENNLEVLKATFGLNIIREPDRILIK